MPSGSIDVKISKYPKTAHIFSLPLPYTINGQQSEFPFFNEVRYLPNIYIYIYIVTQRKMLQWFSVLVAT